MKRDGEELMLRERKRQIVLDGVDAVLTSAPAVFYGFYLLTRPDDDLTVYAGLIAVTASLAVKLVLVAIRRPRIMAEAKDDAEAKAMGTTDQNALIYTLKEDRTATPPLERG